MVYSVNSDGFEESGSVFSYSKNKIMIKQIGRSGYLALIAVAVYVILSGFSLSQAAAQTTVPGVTVGAGGVENVQNDITGVSVPTNASSANNPGLGLQFRRVEGVDNDLSSELEKQEEEAKQEELRQELLRKTRDRAREQAQEGLFPLRPEEIDQMLGIYNATREVAETGGMIVPRAVVKVANISLDPGAAPEIIRTAPGHVTSLTILDISGQPWPVQDVSWGGNFEVTPPEAGGHVIRITPLSAHGFGNMSIRLIDLATPVTFSLNTSPDLAFYRFDATIPEYGPNGLAPIIDSARGPVAGSALMTSILDGSPPSASQRLTVSGTDGRTTVWRVSGQLYVRTPHSLLSPGWTSSASSSDGMRVYAVNQAPVLLLSDRGNMVRAHIGKEEIVDDGQ